MSLTSSVTISSNAIYRTGLKKWVMQKFFFISSDIFADKIFNGIVDVLDEIIELFFLVV